MSRHYIRKPGLPSQVLDGELILLDSEHDVFFSSNAVGAHIWERLDTPTTLDVLTESILDAFEGADRATVEADAAELLQAMLDKNLIEIAESAATRS